MGTYFLFTMPDALSGAARCADLWGALDDYNQSPNAETADQIAIWNDWRTVGTDLKSAMDSQSQSETQMSLFD